MGQQSILDFLQGKGFGDLNWSDLPNLSQGFISSVLAQQYDINEADLPSQLFQTIDPEMLRAASYKTYSPQLQSKGQSMLVDLYKNLGGQAATRAAGGLAGSGGFQKQQQQGRDVYGKSMADVLVNIQKQQSQATNLISDRMQSWDEIAQRIKGLR